MAYFDALQEDPTFLDSTTPVGSLSKKRQEDWFTQDIRTKSDILPKADAGAPSIPITVFGEEPKGELKRQDYQASRAEASKAIFDASDEILNFFLKWPGHIYSKDEAEATRSEIVRNPVNAARVVEEYAGVGRQPPEAMMRRLESATRRYRSLTKKPGEAELMGSLATIDVSEIPKRIEGLRKNNEALLKQKEEMYRDEPESRREEKERAEKTGSINVAMKANEDLIAALGQSMAQKTGVVEKAKGITAGVLQEPIIKVKPTIDSLARGGGIDPDNLSQAVIDSQKLLAQGGIDATTGERVDVGTGLTTAMSAIAPELIPQFAKDAELLKGGPATGETGAEKPEEPKMPDPDVERLRADYAEVSNSPSMGNWFAIILMVVLAMMAGPRRALAYFAGRSREGNLGPEIDGVRSRTEERARRSEERALDKTLSRKEAAMSGRPRGRTVDANAVARQTAYIENALGAPSGYFNGMYGDDIELFQKKPEKAYPGFHVTFDEPTKMWIRRPTGELGPSKREAAENLKIREKTMQAQSRSNTAQEHWAVGRLKDNWSRRRVEMDDIRTNANNLETQLSRLEWSSDQKVKDDLRKQIAALQIKYASKALEAEGISAILDRAMFKPVGDAILELEKED